MIKYVAADISFQEIPGQIALVFYISGCPNHCPGCHSPILQQDVGMPLTADVLREYCARYEGMFDCVCFMGDGGDLDGVARLALEVRILGKNAALYTGTEREDVPHHLLGLLRYLKTGPYIEARGGLASINTNQHFYQVDKHYHGVDLTREFQRYSYEMAAPADKQCEDQNERCERPDCEGDILPDCERHDPSIS